MNYANVKQFIITYCAQILGFLVVHISDVMNSIVIIITIIRTLYKNAVDYTFISQWYISKFDDNLKYVYIIHIITATIIVNMIKS